MAAFNAPAIPAPRAVDFGATDSWLRANAATAFMEFIQHDGNGSEGFYTLPQQALYLKSFVDPVIVSKAIAAIYAQPSPADDEVDLTVTVRFTNDEAYVANSAQSATLMLPWSVRAFGRTFKTFNPAMSAAIRDLLPAKAQREGRLSPETLLGNLGSVVGDYIQPEWKVLPAYDLLAQIKPLEERYNVRINPSASGAGSSTPGWNADLRWDDLPADAVATVRLPIEGNALGEASTIPAARGFLQTTLAIPWVARALKGRPDVALHVFVGHAGTPYLDEQEQKQFVSEMTRLGYRAVLQRVRPNLGSAFEVMFENKTSAFSDWLVFPDKTMLLRNYSDEANPMLDLDAKALGGKNCPDRDYMCDGLLRSPDGKVLQ